MQQQQQQQRKRSRVACETCRDLKRKCDGATPCGACVRFEYECSYPEKASRKKRPRIEPEPSPPAPVATSGWTSTSHGTAETASSTPLNRSPVNEFRTVEANSGAAFVRKLALGLDPKNAPPMHLFAWNAFLGARDADARPVPRPVTEALSRDVMMELAGVYFDKVDPCYGFIDRRDFDRRLRSRWLSSEETPYDAVLCGVAAIGCLFSHIQPLPVETDLVESAKVILERAMHHQPSHATITAWILRTTYLRMTGTSHAAWMASCILMHLIEASGLHREPANETVLDTHDEDVDPELRRRLVGVACHLNVWMAFDTGRSRVTIHNMANVLPSPRPGSFTEEILGLLPYCDVLDPEKVTDAHGLEAMLSSVLARAHTQPPSILAQSNLMLCICRRLKSLNTVLRGKVLEQVLALARRGVEAAQIMVDGHMPWHHMANIPFQVVCILLVIDTVQSIAQLEETMRCLKAIVKQYNTEATREALQTASLLVLLHQRRNQIVARKLTGILEMFPVAQEASNEPEPQELGWLENLATEMPDIDFGFEQWLNEGFAWDFGNV